MLALLVQVYDEAPGPDTWNRRLVEEPTNGGLLSRDPSFSQGAFSFIFKGRKVPARLKACCHPGELDTNKSAKHEIRSRTTLAVRLTFRMPEGGV